MQCDVMMSQYLLIQLNTINNNYKKKQPLDVFIAQGFCGSFGFWSHFTVPTLMIPQACLLVVELIAIIWHSLKNRFGLNS